MEEGSAVERGPCRRNGSSGRRSVLSDRPFWAKASISAAITRTVHVQHQFRCFHLRRSGSGGSGDQDAPGRGDRPDQHVAGGTRVPQRAACGGLLHRRRPHEGVGRDRRVPGRDVGPAVRVRVLLGAWGWTAHARRASARSASCRAPRGPACEGSRWSRTPASAAAPRRPAKTPDAPPDTTARGTARPTSPEVALATPGSVGA